MKIKSLFKSARNGVKEITTGDMTVGETYTVGVGVGGVVCGVVLHTVVEPVVGVVVAGSNAAWCMALSKGLVVGGVAMSVAGLGSAWVRGFSEQLRTELSVNQ